MPQNARALRHIRRGQAPVVLRQPQPRNPMRRFLPAFALFGSLAACASHMSICTVPPPQSWNMTSTASAGDYAICQIPGGATIAGQAFLTTRGGDVKRGAGRDVTLD